MIRKAKVRLLTESSGTSGLLVGEHAADRSPEELGGEALVEGSLLGVSVHALV